VQYTTLARLGFQPESVRMTDPKAVCPSRLFLRA
jgi:hypothetical protein